MKKTRYNEEQIVRILRETDRDTIADVAKRHGISESSIYGWQKGFGSMVTDDVNRYKELQTENSRLKNCSLKEIAAKNARRASTQRSGFLRSQSRPESTKSLHATQR